MRKQAVAFFFAAPGTGTHGLPDNSRLGTLLYQTGYLTIKGFRQLGEKRTITDVKVG